MIKILSYIWQLPQNILALILTGILSLKYGKPEKSDYKGIRYHWFKGWRSGVSLGNYILLGNWSADDLATINHEWGHTRQSLYFGPLYLIAIGLPSGLGNLYDQWFHTKARGWSYEQSYFWYYNQPWEQWADELGGVDRHF